MTGGALEPRLALVGLAVAFAFTVQATLGFGSQVIAISLAALLYPLEEVIPVVVALNVLLCAVLVARGWRRVDAPLLLRDVGPTVAGGAALGLAAAALAGRGPPRWPFGALVVVTALLELARLARGRAPGGLSGAARRAWLLAAGVVHGLYASGGPLVVTALARAPLERDVLRATLQAMWLVLNAAVLATLVARGAWTAAAGARALVLLPCVALALLAGGALQGRLPERALRIGVQLVLVIAGAALLT